MTANDIFQGSRVAHVRELESKIARLYEELSQIRAERDSLRSHFDLALAAALDAAHMPQNGHFAIIDGWNALLGSASILAPDERRSNMQTKRTRLCKVVQDWLSKHPNNYAWIIFDGAHANGYTDCRLRISFTGGTGEHRADRMICDYLRMCRITGCMHKIVVFTEDADLKKEVTDLGAEVFKHCVYANSSPE